MSKKNKYTLNAEINEIPFKTIIWVDEKGFPKAVKDYPKKIDPSIHISGCHIFRDNPEQNHYDHFYKWNKWKDYSKENTYSLRFENTSIGSVLLI